MSIWTDILTYKYHMNKFEKSYGSDGKPLYPVKTTSKTISVTSDWSADTKIISIKPKLSGYVSGAITLKQVSGTYSDTNNGTITIIDDQTGTTVYSSAKVSSTRASFELSVIAFKTYSVYYKVKTDYQSATYYEPTKIEVRYQVIPKEEYIELG